MSFHYPNGKKYIPLASNPKTNAIKNTNESFSNRGMTLEEDLNETNGYYLERDIAVIHKKPTPVQIVHVDYPRRSAAVINYRYNTGLKQVFINK